MYNALSLCLCGTEDLSDIIRVLAAYALVKHRTTMMQTLADMCPFDSHERHSQMYMNAIQGALRLGVWGTDLQLFPLSLLLNRPIFTYNTFYNTSHSVRTLNLADTTDTLQLAQRFLVRYQGTTAHFLFRSDVQSVTLSSGSISSLPFPPLSLFNIMNQHWVALLMLSPSVTTHIPIPRTRILV